ncbi:MAG: LysR family transcriptional regulator [Actinomycetota bacterium]|nr:LysR family transcriptional regulator [Actinomycetota bacterium]
MYCIVVITELHEYLPRPSSSLTVEQLRTFAVVAELQHVTRAAGALGLTQPAVSHQLKALERKLGLAVFERVGRGVRLTADGRALLPALSSALAALRSLEEAAAARTGLLEGELTVAASNTIGIYRVPEWSAGFLDRHPGVGLRVRTVNTHEAIGLLREAVVDCALVEGPDAHDGLEELGVGSDELVVVAAVGHPLAARSSVLPADLAVHRYLARERGSGTEALAAELLGPAYRAGPVLELGQVDAVRAAVLAGLGFAVLPLAAIGDDLDAGRLRRLPTERPALRRTLSALRRPASHSPALDAFWAHLAALVEDASPARPAVAASYPSPDRAIPSFADAPRTVPDNSRRRSPHGHLER